MHGERCFKSGSLVCVAGIALFAFTGLRQSFADDSPHLGGKWKINQSQSDNASEKIHEAETKARMQASGYPADPSRGGGYPNGGGYPSGTDYPGTGYPGGGGMGMPGGRGGIGPMGPMSPTGRIGRGQRGPIGQNAGLSGEDMEYLSSTPKILNIQQDEKQIAISDDNGQTTTLYPDGKKHKEKDSSGQSTTTKARWEGKRLVTESKLGHSGKLTATYELSPDGKQLDVVQHLDNSQLSEPLVIRRVYDSSAGAE